MILTHHLLCTRFVIAVYSEEDFLCQAHSNCYKLRIVRGQKQEQFTMLVGLIIFFKYIYTGWPIRLYTVPPQGSVNNRDASTPSCLMISWTLNGKVVRVTAVIFTGDKLQRLQLITRLSPWRPFRFCVILGVGSSRYNDVKRTTWRLKSPTTAPFVQHLVLFC